jgi:hypothetical protein
MDTIDELLAIEEIKGLKARYFRYVDLKDWEGLHSLLATDALFDISADAPGCILTGPDEIVATVSAALADCVSVHHGHCPEIHVLSDSTAVGVWAMEDNLSWNEGSSRAGMKLHGFGHYHERYEKVGDDWAIKSLTLVRLRVDRHVDGK